MNILCLCNYGQVRSVTMRNRLKERGHTAYSAGMMTIIPWELDNIIDMMDLTIICNKPNYEEKLKREFREFDEKTAEMYGNIISHVVEKHKDKTIICDKIGVDRWGQPDHPLLVPICNEYLDDLEKKGVLKNPNV